MTVETLSWLGSLPGRCRLLDQTRLPLEVVHLELDHLDGMVDAIRRLAVRGAPAIGIAAAYGLLLGIQHSRAGDTAALMEEIAGVSKTLADARPTAVNLFWALERMQNRAAREARSGVSREALLAALLEEALAIHREDADQCARMGEYGAPLVPDGGTVLTHCNAGALATGGMGTALAPIYVAHRAGKRVSVLADETRPLLQGARLTAWELSQAGVPVTLITDNMAARMMALGRVQAVFVGSDRIAANGDVCNKIGTYGVAVLARHHGIPFYVVAPLSTFDGRMPSGAGIPIEERAAEEVTEGLGRRIAPPGVPVENPAFDVTPAALVTAIVTEAGVVEHPDAAGVARILASGRAAG